MGKPRMSGARAALEYFHVPDDDDLRLAEYAARKQEVVVRLIQAGDFSAYPDALRFIIAVKDAGIRAGRSRHRRHDAGRGGPLRAGPTTALATKIA